jgi:hypothetical protein
MVRVEVVILASVGVFGRQFRPSPDDHNVQKRNALSDSISIVNWMEGLKLLKWLRMFCNRSGP